MVYIRTNHVVSIGRHYLSSSWSEWKKGALRQSNAKRLYMDEESTEAGEVN